MGFSFVRIQIRLTYALHNKWDMTLNQVMIDDSEEKILAFQDAILQYWQVYGRHYLPWRSTCDPWQLIVAEVLLRKTTSSQAEDIFNKLRVFTSDDIIRMEISELEEVLKPIGMSRVKSTQLKEIALVISTANKENLESDVFLRSIRGVGKYISNMVRCGAFGAPVPALDTNMIRIIQRVFGYESQRKRPREDRKLWEYAETLVPPNNPREFNWGILDFGAQVCTFYNPKCGECPMQGICMYFKTV